MFGRDEKVSSIRLTAVQYIILVIFMILAYGLWRLQVMQSDFYAQLAEKNRIRNVPILAPRGKILDREGRTMFVNEVADDVLGLDEQVLADVIGVTSLRDTPDNWRSEASIGTHWLDIRIVPVPDRWGARVARLIVACDITARKRLERAPRSCTPI